jgi:Xaa-Pro aminopeptidase
VVTAPADRRDRLRATVRAAGLDAALVTRLVNVRYLTGFTGSNAALLVPADPDRPDVLCTDGRYTLQAGLQSPDVELLIERSSATALAGRAAADHLGRLGFESHDVTVDLYEALRKPGGELVGLRRAVEDQRAVKDDGEVELLREACAIADRALADLVAAGGLRAGRTELEIGRDLDARMLGHGASAPSFETIVAAGPNSAIPHHRPENRTLQRGDFVKLDFGAEYGGYHSDMTRTLVLGPPADWQREVYELVHTAQAAGRAALEIGAEVRAIDAAARDVIAAAGRAEEFGHGLGHGVGLEIHEAPALSPLGAGTLADRMAVTVEPGVYLPGRGGVRIEDTLVVREGAEPELLTLTSKDLTVL